MRVFGVGIATVALVAAASATTLAQPEETPPAAYVTGTHALGEIVSPGTRTVTVDGVVQLRDLTAIQVEQWDDERFSGSSTLVHSQDEYQGLVGPKWGTVRLENDGGTWVGSYIGVQFPREDGPDYVSYVTTYVGEGSYKGLGAICHSAYPEGPGWDGEGECAVFTGPVPAIEAPPSDLEAPPSD